MDDLLDHERRKHRVAIEKEAVENIKVHMQTEDVEKLRRSRWHIGKEVPIALIGMLVVQTVGFVWGAASLYAKVENNEKNAVTAAIVQAAIDRKQDEEQRRSEDRIVIQMREVSGKLDQILFKGAK